MSTTENLRPTPPEPVYLTSSEVEQYRMFSVERFYVGDEMSHLGYGALRHGYSAAVMSGVYTGYPAALGYPPAGLDPNPSVQLDVEVIERIGPLPGRLLGYTQDSTSPAGDLETVELQPTTFRRPTPDPLVVSAETLYWPKMAYDDIVQALRGSRFKPVVERLDYLNERADNAERIIEINPESVIEFGRFLLVSQPAALPSVELDPSGHVSAQWTIQGQEQATHSSEEGTMLSAFEPTQPLRFTAKFGASAHDASLVELYGVIPVQALAGTLRYFLPEATGYVVNDDNTSVAAGDIVTENDSVPLVEPDGVERGIRQLKDAGFVEFAERLEFFHREIEDDPDETSISAQSLDVFFNFVAKHELSGHPSTWVDPYGNVGLEWRIPDPERLEKLPASFAYDDDDRWGKGDGILAIVFLPDDSAKLAGTSGPVGRGVKRLVLSKTVPTNDVIDELQPFLRRMGAP